MKLIAHTFDGMHTHKATTVKAIHLWIDKVNEHKVSVETINLLLNKAKETKQMQIYTSGFHTGEIDAYQGNYLSIYGAQSVYWLELDGEIIYRAWKDVEKMPCHKTIHFLDNRRINNFDCQT